jgi:hypothetical protein
MLFFSYPFYYFFSEKSGGMTFGPFVSPICLPSAKLLHKNFANLTISGWGKVNYEGFSTATDRGIDNLQDAQVPVVDTAVCTTDKVSKKASKLSISNLDDNANFVGRSEYD